MDSNGTKIVGIIVAAALVIGGIVWFTTSNNDDEANNSNSSEQITESASDQQNSQTIVGLAVATPDLSTLVSAVQAADLVDTLNSEGPFTVFAPTNEAFAALPDGTLDSLLLPENKQQLSDILTYHVVAGKVMASDLSDGQVIETVNGETLTVSIKDGKVMIGDAEVVTADVEASNGVVHVINAVLLP